MANTIDFTVKARDEVTPVVKKIKNETERATKDMKQAWKEAEGALLGIGAGMAAIGTAGVMMLNKFVQAASDSVETASKFSVVFGQVEEKANAVARSMRDMYGMGEMEAKKMLSSTGDLLTGLGMAGDSALDLSERTAKLGADLASFANYAGGAAGATEALTKALLGEREQAKMLGIVINEEMIKTEKLKMAQEGLVFATEQQAKAEATIRIAYEQSKNAIGDRIRTFDQLANLQRTLTSRTQDLAVKIGNVLIPAATKLVKVATNVVTAISDWIDRNPFLTSVIVKFAAALSVLVGSSGFLILATVGISKLVGMVTLAKTILVQALPAIIGFTGGIKAMTVALLTNPLTIWITALTALGWALHGIITNWEDFKGMFVYIADLIGDKLNWLKEAFNMLLNPIQGLIDKVVEFAMQFEWIRNLWQRVVDFFYDSIEKIREKFSWLLDPLIWIGEKLGLIKTEAENLGEGIDEALDIHERAQNTIDMIDEIKVITGETKVETDKLKDSNNELETSFNETKTEVDEYVKSLGDAKTAEEEKIIATNNTILANAKLIESYGNLGLNLETTNESSEEFYERTQAEAQEFADNQMAIMEQLKDDLGIILPELYLKELETLQEIRDEQIKVVENAKISSELKAEYVQQIIAEYEKEKLALQGVIDKTNEATEAARERTEAESKKGNQVYIVYDEDGNPIRGTTSQSLSSDEKELGYTIQKLHGGGTFRSPIPGGEGIVLLRDNETVRTPQQEKALQSGATITINQGAIVINAQRLDDREINRVGDKLMDTIISKSRAYNLRWAR